MRLGAFEAGVPNRGREYLVRVAAANGSTSSINIEKERGLGEVMEVARDAAQGKTKARQAAEPLPTFTSTDRSGG